MAGETERFEIIDERFSTLVKTSAQVERLYQGCRWAEGPAWFAAGPLPRLDRHPERPHAALGRDRRQRSACSGSRPATPTATPSTGRAGWSPASTATGASPGPSTTARITVLADRFDGQALQQPNDVVVKSDGSIWFTDPAYGIDSDYEGDQADSEIGACHVYRVDPRRRARSRIVADDFVRPNGLAFSPDETPALRRPTPARRTCRTARGTCGSFNVAADGTLSGGEVFADLHGRPVRRLPARRRRAASGRAPPTASTATTQTARCSGRSSCRRRWPTWSSAARAGTGCSSPPPRRCTASCCLSTAPCVDRAHRHCQRGWNTVNRSLRPAGSRRTSETPMPATV